MQESILTEGLNMNDLRKRRNEAAVAIDPLTADFHWSYGYVVDPYGDRDDLVPEEKQVGRLHWARSPGSDMWISFYDLPKDVREALWDRIDRGLLREKELTLEEMFLAALPLLAPALLVLSGLQNSFGSWAL